MRRKHGSRHEDTQRNSGEGGCFWTRRKPNLARFNPEQELTRLFPSKSALIADLLHKPDPKPFPDLVFSVSSSGHVPDPRYQSLLPLESEQNSVYIWCYKVSKCDSEVCDPQHCFDFHSEEDRRRPLTVLDNGLWSYKPDMCRRGEGCMGKDCTLAHSCFEIDFHPMRFRTEKCGLKKNKLGVCRAGVHCPRVHEGEQTRSAAPNVVGERSGQTQESPNEGNREIVGPVAEEPMEVERLSLSELLKTRLMPQTHQLIEGLLTAQQERLRFHSELKAAKTRLDDIASKIRCAFCQQRPRKKLLSCGHSVCEECETQEPGRCRLCSAQVMTLALKTIVK